MTDSNAESTKIRKRKVGRPKNIPENPAKDPESPKMPKRTSRTPVKNYQETSDESLLEESPPKMALEQIQTTPEVKKRARKSQKQSPKKETSNAAISSDEKSSQKRGISILFP